VRGMLGVTDGSVPLRLLDAIACADAQGVLAVVQELQALSQSFDAALQDLANLLLRIAIAQTVPEALPGDVPERDRVLALAARIDPETVQLYYQIATQGRDDLPLAPDEHAGFTMTLLRMLAFRPEDVAYDRPEAQQSKSRESAAAPAGRTAGFDGDWPKLCRQLAVTGVAKELARNAELAKFQDGSFDLVVPKSMPHLAESGYKDKLKAALEQHLGRPVRVRVAAGEVRGTSAAALEASERSATRSEAARAMQGDGFVKDLVTLLDGKVLEQSVQPAPKNN